MTIEYSKIKNKAKITARTSWFLAVFFMLPLILPFYENNFLSGAWALSFISLFLIISASVTAVIFQSRANKMKKLLNREKLIESWQMNRETLRSYVDETSSTQKNKSKMLIKIIGIFFLVFTVFFMIILDSEDRLGFFLIMFSVFILIFSASKFFPWLYHYKNVRGDGYVLIGSKYIYINGYFHNWDFPMSGLEKLKAIEVPFRGIQLIYHYTDRTGPNSFELKIPVPENIDLKELIRKIETSS